MPAPRILIVDIETSPNKVFTWGMWNQNINPEQIIEVSRVICWGAMWDDKPTKFFRSVYHDGRKLMLKELWELLNEANIVVHYNGTKFDIPKINTEFLMEGFDTSPSPYTQVDLLKTIKKFSFQFARLGFVCPELNIGTKLKHAGFELWKKCDDDDPKAWETMKKYNLQDVVITKQLYHRLLPWMNTHPRLYLGNEVCPYCNSNNVRKRGTQIALKWKYQIWQCKDCRKYHSGERISK